jgi:hypothetical protein
MAMTLGFALRRACRGSVVTPPVCVGSGTGAVTTLETTDGRHGLPRTRDRHAASTTPPTKPQALLVNLWLDNLPVLTWASGIGYVSS